MRFMPSHPTPTLDEIRSLPARAARNPGRSAKAPMPPPAIAIRIPLRIAGLLVLGLCAIVLAALASWSVDDPSLSLATTKSAANWLGYPGAVIADLVFQFLGLAGLVMIVPVALWGWTMARRHVVSHAGLRLASWIGAVLLFAGVFAFVAMPETWPLPTGLGGLAGMLFTNLAGLIAGADPQPVTSTLFAIILTAPALALFWIAMGLGTSVPARPPKASAARQAAEDDEREPNPIVEVAMGAVVHMGYSLRTAFRRARAEHAARRAAEDSDVFAHDVEPSMAAPEVHVDREPVAVVPQRRIHTPVQHEEPSFEPSARIMAQPDYDDTAIDYPDEPEDDSVPFVPDAPMPSRTQRGDSRFHPADPVAPRVTAPAPRPSQGQRVFREAQGSLLDEPHGFELPELSLLAEPKRSGPMPEHAPERLEDMARQLEAVLADFGVKGDIINVRPGPVVTLFELEPAPGIKSSRVISLADDIARSMSAISARVAVVPGRNAIGIELPNQSRETAYFRE
ncbi:DNA translocase FtsK 4TM domain-containing protein, partial [uncultured Devosia sp.]|uniref:DNA translocase FtsK 4TM domain-containing protein n=1 Tax=uncultured Devosia sp. TaxID=211434 RepID=UPI002610D782